jgi:hypothetical protein
MLLPLLPLLLLPLSVSWLSAQEASLDCSNIATAQTQPVRGPAGLSAVVKVATGDDHSKDSHDCMAEYTLVVQPVGSGPPVIADILSSDGDWGRKLAVRLDGFSADGKQVFGTLAEGGYTPAAMVFSYHASNQHVDLLDLKKALKQIAAAKCGMSATVAGTTDSGAIVLESGPATSCGTRWLLDPASGASHRLPQGQSVHALFR